MTLRLVLVLATVLSGVLAGVFAAFSLLVMPGLARVDHATFVGAMRSINAHIHPTFLLVFLGAPVVAVAGTVLAWREGTAPVLVTAGLVLALLGLVITVAANIPLNEALAHGADDAATRIAFETPWVRWNLARTLTSTAATACLAWALTLTA